MRNLSICLLLAIITCAVYWPARRFAFVNFDDETYIYENTHVTQGLTPANARWAFQTFDVANYHPLTWLSWLLDSSLFGLRPGPFHIENVLLHLLSTLLLFDVLRRATAQPWPSAFVAAIFALHPVHVESVAWISERKDVLSTLFLLLALSMYLAYAKTNWRTHKWASYLAMLVFYICGLLAKGMIVTFPFLLLLLDYWPLRRVAPTEKNPPRFRRVTWRMAWVEKFPLLILSLVSCILTYKAQREGGALAGLDHVPFSLRMENGIVSYVRYLGKSFCPINLSPYYPYRSDYSASLILASLALLIAISILCLRLVRARPYLAIGWFWFLGTLVPVIGIVQAGGQSIADRYLYVPLIGLTIMVAWAGVEFLQFARVAVISAAILIVAASAITARHQLNYWSDTRTLFDHALRVVNGNAVAHVQLGYLDARENNTTGALNHYQQAIKLDPAAYVPEFDLANLLLKNHPDQAIEHYQRAAQLNPAASKVENNWGTALMQLGRPGDAYIHFQTAVRIDPNYADAHYALGQILFASGYYKPAAAEFKTVLRINPNSTGAKRGLNAIAAMQSTKQN